ncbi:MAG: photosystem II protein Y [Synechococcaceae cyanobacterium RL_1_2]|nr:photosystem II protein Y [Synechococcaceae cyanobacterium RL_1_2]
MDFRLLLVFAPLGLAAAWAAFNIAPVAITQVQGFLKRLNESSNA